MPMEVAVFYDESNETTLVSAAEEDVPESSVYRNISRKPHALACGMN